MEWKSSNVRGMWTIILYFPKSPNCRISNLGMGPEHCMIINRISAETQALSVNSSSVAVSLAMWDKYISITVFYFTALYSISPFLYTTGRLPIISHIALQSWIGTEAASTYDSITNLANIRLCYRRRPTMLLLTIHNALELGLLQFCVRPSIWYSLNLTNLTIKQNITNRLHSLKWNQSCTEYVSW